MEKIPQAVRLETCRYFDPTSQLSLEDAVRALQKYASWQLNASVFADTCGLAAQFKSVTGGLKAILAPPSSGEPTIVEVKEDERGFFGTPKGYYDVSKASCAFCGQQGDHWAPRCPVFKTISARLQRAAEFKFCLLCLRAGHSIGSQLCRARLTTCRFCRNAAHHKALCPTYLERYFNGTAANDRQPIRSQGGTPPSQPETGRYNPAYSGAKNGKASGHHGSGPGAGRPANEGGTTAKERAKRRTGLATHAAATSIEEPTDGLAKPSTTSTDVPDSSNGQRCAEHQVVSPPEMHQPAVSLSEDGSGHATRDAVFPPNGNDSSGIVHDSNAPTDPVTDEEEFDYDACAQDALLNGVGTFGAVVPSGPELRRTHLLECVTAEVFNPVDPSRKETVIVFFDCGSSQTFVSDKLADALAITLDTFANEESVQLDTFQTTIGLVTTNRERIVLDAAASPPVVHRLRAAFISAEDVPELRRNNCTLIPVNVAPDIVIGRDIQHHFRKKDLVPVLPSGFCLVHSTLRTMVAGLGHVPKTTADGTPSAYVGTPSSSSSNASPGNSLESGPLSLGSFFAISAIDEDCNLEKMAENFWKTENIGIEPSSQTPDDQLAHERFKQTTRIDGEGRYQCRLPWKTPDGEAPSNVVLPTNHAVARGRLTSFQRSHLSKLEFLLPYGEGFTTMEHDGIIELFVPAERNSALLHFLAHHAVIKESSATTKVRHVFDGSAKLPGKPSINDLLHRGPVLLPKMAAILIRTRLSQLLLIADIAKAFLQVSLHPADRSACAFIWLKDPLKPRSDDNLVYYRFRRVIFGLKPSPFLLGATIEMHLEKIGTPLAKEIWSSCYVDNVILGADTLEEAQEKYHLSKEYFASAMMQLRQFASNCSHFNAQLPPEDAAELRHLMNLGYEWDVASDCWRISLAARPAKGKPKGRKRCDASALGEHTKRQMLQRVARVFDPIGYLQPVMLPAKLVIQEAWKARPDWDDDPVPDKLTELWAEATKDFEATTINIPRRISDTKIDWLEVHIYVDASKEAYGCAAYLRVPADGHFKAWLVFSRAKVKPLKDAERMTIPRMELMAFMLGARQARFMAETLELSGIRRTIIWSDSMIVLQQIRTPTKSKEVFVENRLSEIRTLQAELRFETRYVNTSENPADLVSRGLPAAELPTCDLWWHASPFLALDVSEWPTQPAVLSSPLATCSDAGEPLQADTRTAPENPLASDGTPSGKGGRRVRFRLPTDDALATSDEQPHTDSTTVLDGTPSSMVASLWDVGLEGTPSADSHKGCCGSFRFYTILKQWRMDTQERLLAAAAIQNPLDNAEQGASPTDPCLPAFVSFFNAAVREPRPTCPPTAILYTDPPARPDDTRPKWLQIRALNVTWSKVQRIYFYHFVTKCSHASAEGTPSVHAFCGARLYTASDMQIAATAAVWQAQRAHLPTKDTRKQLQLVEFHGILYVKGRLNRSSLATTTITPLYLPRQSDLTDLIIYDYHRANLHAGVTTTLANVRVRYWFPHGRRTVANAIKRRCFECRKMTNPAYSIPPWPALPTTRTEISRPFAKIGVDFYGPVLLKPMNLDGTPSKEVYLYYVCLFTCLSVRAVHCELMNDLSTAQFFHVFKRFAARRSYPSEVLSDNGTTFLAARDTIRSILNSRRRMQTTVAVTSSDTDDAVLHSRTRNGAQRSSRRAQGNSLVAELAASDDNPNATEELCHYFTANNITWCTITERAAWKGGVYERMIDLVNYLSNSERDFTLVRPIDLLIPTLQGEQPLDFMDPAEDAGSKEDPDYVPATAGDKFQRRLLKDLQLARRLSDQFGKLWREGYLLELSRQFGKKPLESSRVPAVGDLVLIYDENLPRAQWRYGLVMELHPSSDGVVREASVRLSETCRETRRAVTHLYPLKAMLNGQTTDACPSIDDAPIAATIPASASLAPGGPSTLADSTDTDVAQGNEESGTRRPLPHTRHLTTPRTGHRPNRSAEQLHRVREDDAEHPDATDPLSGDAGDRLQALTPRPSSTPLTPRSFYL